MHISEISGSWLGHLHIDDKEYWNIDKHNPLIPYPHPNPLASDSRYREDLVWLLKGN